MTRHSQLLREGSLCTGYNGLGLAIEHATGNAHQLAFVADPDPAATRLLAHRYPGVPNLGDIKSADWQSVPRVDILTAGYPCQPFSFVGRRKGTDDDRHLWPAVANTIRYLRPRVVFLENVPGHLSLGFGRVLADLATLGYVGSWQCIRASDIGAAHRRDRVFILAWPADGPPPAASIAVQPARRRIRSDAVLTLLPTPRASRIENSTRRRTPSHKDGRHGLALAGEVGEPLHWPRYAAAISRWETISGRTAPAPTQPGEHGPELAPAFTEWIMGLEYGWVTQVPGIDRLDQLALLGNGVMPQQGAQAFSALVSATADSAAP